MRRIQVALAFILALSLPQAALAQETPSETAGEAAWETSSLNFNESFGCGDGVAGPRTPSVGYSGYMNWSTRIRGPWGDFFGRDFSQISGSLVSWTVPMSGGATRRVHQRALPAYQNAAANIAAAGASYPITTVYSFAYRTVGGSTRISTHAVGTAVDINPQQNPYSENLITNMPAWFQQAFIDAGFCWGGQWQDVKDTMHYSWLGPLATPGYGARPAPYPPLTGPANYGSPVLNALLPAFSGAATGWS
ncbi:MAG: M15 family metallopeptidase, partial [Acidimicrobiia bacterium]|nr:M15 family metallopeptidase [Acidimicrobiia bacterium]